MDPRTNPYAPGAGTPPPELAGRDGVIEQAAIALDRVRSGRQAQSLIFHGLRGVGKTVLLNRVRQDAEARGIVGVRMEAPEGRSLPALLAPSLRASLLRLDRGEAVMAGARKALGALAGFISSLKVKYQDIQIGMDITPLAGLADSGDLDNDLGELVAAVGEAAAERQTAIVLFIDELQYVPEDQLAALIMAFHNANQLQLPVTMIAAGLPQLLGQMGRAKSYAERLFQFVSIDRLDRAAATVALCVPAQKAGAAFDSDAVEEILAQTHCYPYFLQEWGKHCWDEARTSPMNLDDARAANDRAIAELDASFFRVRFDRLTPSEKRYMRAMAELGPGPHRSGDVSDILRKKVTTVAPTRATLIAKGMIYSPSHGDTAFTVPLFDGFMKRIMNRV
ncbi:AAA ATPase-like protein [Roseiarcus fermentans]|uniref:AAA ATPase-like protein n=1 Tax=Roseiarcus fermentans TaxID=1473586 RepID=A0A366FMK2_9HYPH|nr:ATP-binding protein [Roseiarcus fermentans]RBP15914.1 AAA ATPase-like protein [Roseiarcus fermentans]